MLEVISVGCRKSMETAVDRDGLDKAVSVVRSEPQVPNDEAIWLAGQSK